MTERFTVSLEKDLADAFEDWRARKGYASRSEAVRDLLRRELAAEGAQGDGACVAVLTYVYDHHAHDLGQQLVQAHHGQHDLSVATLHVHLDHDHCLEATVLRGPLARVRAFGDAVCARRGVQYGALQVVPVARELAPHRHGEAGDALHGHGRDAAGDAEAQQPGPPHEHWTPRP